MDEFITEYFDEVGGVASCPDVADLLDYDPAFVREWARENELPRVGPAFAFTAEHAQALYDEVSAEDDDDADLDEEDSDIEEDGDEDSDTEEEDEDEDSDTEEEDEGD